MMIIVAWAVVEKIPARKTLSYVMCNLFYCCESGDNWLSLLRGVMLLYIVGAFCCC
jgi:hypothetical protein